MQKELDIICDLPGLSNCSPSPCGRCCLPRTCGSLHWAWDELQLARSGGSVRLVDLPLRKSLPLSVSSAVLNINVTIIYYYLLVYLT